jgi:serine/threonine protein phosphatase PrpC
MAHLKLKIGVSRHQGMERDYQEDDFSVRPDLLQPKNAEVDWQQIVPSDWGALLAVADGMGGMNAGEVASELAIKGIDDYFEQLPKNECPTNHSDLLCQSIYHANQHLVDYAKQNPESQNMGTTIVLAWLLESELYVAWSGDSRCYRLRQQQIQQLNHDHSYVQELIDKGKLTVEQAFYHPNKNVITQSLGDTSQHLKPDCQRYALQPNDRFLLCSDGLNTMLTDAQIGQILLEEPDEMLCAKALVDAANAAGGHDNITVIVCDAIGAEVVASPLPYQETPTVKVVSAPAKSSFFANKKILMGFGVAALGILGFWGWKVMNQKVLVSTDTAVIVPSPQSKKGDSDQKVSEAEPISPRLSNPKLINPVSPPNPITKEPNTQFPTTIPSVPTTPKPAPDVLISSEPLDVVAKRFFKTLTKEQNALIMDYDNHCDCLKALMQEKAEAKIIYDHYCKDRSMIDVPEKSTDLYISLAATKDASSLESDRNRLKKK